MNKLKNKRRYQRWDRICLLTFVFSFLILLCGCGFARQSGDVLTSTEDTDTGAYSGEETTTKNNKLEQAEDTQVSKQVSQQPAVYVCGAVNQPGVYELLEGARVVDALQAAGGCRLDASVDYLNQAEYVEDGQKLYVPTKEEAEQLEANHSQKEELDVSSKLDINQAGREELMTLPGIGQAKAEAIIEYRTEHGQFTSIEELKNINGIKDGVYNKIKDSITVG